MNEKENTNQEVDDSSATPLDNEETTVEVSEVAEELKSSDNDQSVGSENVEVDVTFEVEDENGNKFNMFYGMSSQHAMEKHYGKMDNYRSSEGRILQIPYKGKLQSTILDYLGGIRSACTYINSRNIKSMSKCCTFVLVHNQLNRINEAHEI